MLELVLGSGSKPPGVLVLGLVLVFVSVGVSVWASVSVVRG